MKKFLTKLLLLCYCFSVCSLTHVFAMNMHHSDSSPINGGEGSCHEMGNKANEENDDTKNGGELRCCNLIFSGEYEATGFSIGMLQEVDIKSTLGELIEELYNKLSIDECCKSYFPPPGGEITNFQAYHNLIGIIKNIA